MHPTLLAQLTVDLSQFTEILAIIISLFAMAVTVLGFFASLKFYRDGMEIYEPRLAVIIGRSSWFLDEFDRQRLQADNPDIEVVTYDDIADFAKQRRVIISPHLYKAGKS